MTEETKPVIENMQPQLQDDDDFSASKEYDPVTNRKMVMDCVKDCTFLVGSSEPVRYFASKAILAIGSPVFRAMFYDFPDEQPAVITVPDVEPAAFETLLNYFYRITPDIAATLTTVQSSIEVLYAIRKWLVLELEETVVRAIVAMVTPQNVFEVLKGTEFFEIDTLRNKCLEIFTQNTAACLENKDFCALPINLVELLLSQRRFCSEVLVFKSLELYAACNQLTRENCPALERLFRRIRFLQISPEAFGRDISKTPLMSASEKLAIMLHSSTWNDEMPLPVFVSDEDKFSELEVKWMEKMRKFFGSVQGGRWFYECWFNGQKPGWHDARKAFFECAHHFSIEKRQELRNVFRQANMALDLRTALASEVVEVKQAILKFILDGKLNLSEWFGLSVLPKMLTKRPVEEK